MINYIDVIYLKELEIKDPTDATKWANYLDHLEFDVDGKLFTRLVCENPPSPKKKQSQYNTFHNLIKLKSMK